METVRKDMVPERIFSFETPPAPIPQSDIKETITAEVVVVGGGIAGLSAALSAAEAGARTVVVEKTKRFYSHGGDVAAIGSRLQKKLGIEIDPNEVVLNLMKYGANKPDQRLIRMWAEGSGATMDWLMDMTDAMGYEVTIFQYPPPAAFDNTNEYYPQYLVTHEFRMQIATRALKENAIKKGVTLYPQHRGMQLVREGKGRVTGIITRNSADEYIQFNATRGIILCTGDYNYNSEMMAKYCPQVAYLPSMMPTSTGDGHQMAMWIGAQMEPAPHAPISHAFAGGIGNYPFLQVNIKGERFQNEDVPGQSLTNALERQPGKTAWQVFDARYREEVPYMGIGHGKYILTDETAKRLTERMLTADTIEELGAKMEVPVETFEATVARYNELAKLGKDLDFGKRADRLTTIEKPPFYAGKSHYNLLVVMGGIVVNDKLQAVDENWDVIPGLYLAGNTVGNRFAVDYPTMCPGISLGMALHHGRVAGTNAATLEK
jgi:fumarate reductase flavoprotein subunit